MGLIRTSGGQNPGKARGTCPDMCRKVKITLIPHPDIASVAQLDICRIWSCSAATSAIGSIPVELKKFNEIVIVCFIFFLRICKLDNALLICDTGHIIRPNET